MAPSPGAVSSSSSSRAIPQHFIDFELEPDSEDDPIETWANFDDDAAARAANAADAADTPSHLPRHAAPDDPATPRDEELVDGVATVRLIDITPDGADADADTDDEDDRGPASLWDQFFCAFDTADASLDHVRAIAR